MKRQQRAYVAWVWQVRSTVVYNLMNRYDSTSYEDWRTAEKGVERQRAKVEPEFSMTFRIVDF